MTQIVKHPPAWQGNVWSCYNLSGRSSRSSHQRDCILLTKQLHLPALAPGEQGRGGGGGQTSMVKHYQMPVTASCRG